MSLDENKAVIRRFVDAWNRRDLESAHALLDRALVDHDSISELQGGYNGVRQRHEMFIAAFPDVQLEANDLVAEGDRVAGRFTFRGTHTGPFMGAPPTGRQIEVSNIDINRVVGGRIVERWGSFDVFGLLTQLGMVPAPTA